MVRPKQPNDSNQQSSSHPTSYHDINPFFPKQDPLHPDPFYPEPKSMGAPKLFSDSYDKSQFTKKWDATTVIEYIVKLMMSEAGKTGETDDIEILAHRARLFSALKAFTGESYEKIQSNIEYLFGMYFERKLSPEKELEIREILKVEKDKEWLERYIEKHSEDTSIYADAFMAILRYRVQIQKAMNIYSGEIEGSGGGYVGMMKAKSIYDATLQEANQKIDSILVLLLGEDFNKSFTELELIEKYNYPTITDYEIRHWIIENW